MWDVTITSSFDPTSPLASLIGLVHAPTISGWAMALIPFVTSPLASLEIFSFKKKSFYLKKKKTCLLLMFCNFSTKKLKIKELRSDRSSFNLQPSKYISTFLKEFKS
jgi:hypothetical protein